MLDEPKSRLEPPGGASETAGRPWISLGGSPSKLGEPLKKLQRWKGLGLSWLSL